MVVTTSEVAASAAVEVVAASAAAVEAVASVAVEVVVSAVVGAAAAATTVVADVVATIGEILSARHSESRTVRIVARSASDPLVTKRVWNVDY